MKGTIKRIAPWLAATAIGGALIFAPVATASTADLPPSPSDSQGAPAQSGADPQVPYGTNPDPQVFNDPYLSAQA